MKPSCPNIRLRLRFFCFVLFLFSQHEPLSAAITVQTADGRVLSGEVDEKTGDQLLWIRQQKEQILLTTSVRWSAITAAADASGALPLDQLPQILRGQANSEPPLFLAQLAADNVPPDCQGNCLPAPPQPGRRIAPARKPRVRSLDVEAFLVNLDRDVEPDGLELVIAALDDHGQPVPVKGSLYVRLWGERIQPHGSLVRYEDLQKWTQSVVPVDFTDGVASYALRFRTVRPEFDLGLHSEAMVNVRLGVFGQGNIAASVPVQIRNFNPFRDRLQLTHGSRFLPNELTGSVRHQLPHRTHTRQLRNRHFRHH